MISSSNGEKGYKGFWRLSLGTLCSRRGAKSFALSYKVS